MAQYKRVEYMSPEEFTNMVNLRNPDSSNVVSMLYGPGNVTLYIYNDRDPQFWTSYDDEYIVFDSWDAGVESTIQANKTQVWLTSEPSVSLTDTQVLPLPSNLTNYLHAMAEARCFAFQKQQPNPKSEQREGRQRIRSMRGKWRHQRQKYEGPDFGR